MEAAQVGTAITPVLWIIFFISVLTSAVFGLLLSYHWIRYSASSTLTFFSIVTYACGCVVLLGTMLAAIIAL